MGVPASRSDEEEKPYHSFANYLLSRLCPKRQTQVYNVSIIQSGGGTCIPYPVPSHPPLAPTFSHAIWSYVSTIRASCLVVQPQPHMHVRCKGTWERQPTSKDTSLEPFSLSGGHHVKYNDDIHVSFAILLLLSRHSSCTAVLSYPSQDSNSKCQVVRESNQEEAFAR